MKVIRSLGNNVSFDSLKEVYARGNALAIENSFSLCIGFTDMVYADGNISSIRGTDVSCIDGCYLSKGYMVNVKEGSLLKLDSIFKDDETLLARVKPFNKEYKDYWVNILFIQNNEILYDKLYEIEN